ncbi:MAG: glycosyl transferase [Deltaproteobacteria bacterium]|nr:MAG: glycosyl transferase [Deltaproteobacteria bacterium]
MSDFFQNGEIATFHRLKHRDIQELEEELQEATKHRPISLVLPYIPIELQGPGLPRIVEELKNVKYLKNIVVGIGRANAEEFRQAKKFFSTLPQKPKLIWCTGPAMENLYNLLAENGINVGDDGKGRSAWMSYGYILALEDSQVIALHDCDIVSYNRDLLARLCYPVAHPNIGFGFCKGYYSRVTDQMYGRVTRIFVTPLIRALKETLGTNQFLEYLDSFRYILAGEFSMDVDLARLIRIPGDWGLEVGVLAEIHRNCAQRRICQIDLSDNYEHKHQPLTLEDPNEGLLKMGTDIAKSLFRTMASMGYTLTNEFFLTLRSSYLRVAQDFIARYEYDSEINGLKYDRHKEGSAAEGFLRCIISAGQQFLEMPVEVPYISNWNRVLSAVPNIFEVLINAVEEDDKH